MSTVREEPVGGWGRLPSVSLFFLRLGATAFGGPAVYIAMMRDEVVSRRRWLTDAHFLDLLGATNLIPGPNAAEMAMHIGRLRAGWRGLVLSGLCFTAPATAITLAFAWSYVRFGSTPELSWVLYGVKPIVIGVMVNAIFSLSRPMVSRPLLLLLGGSVLALYFLGVNEIALLFGAGLVVVLWASLGHLRAEHPVAAFALPGLPWLAGAGAAGASSFSLGVLFLTLLKIGCILYGGGYVLVTFLRADFVDRLGWLTEQQLLDAVAAGQVTPGPLLSTVTFIGYILGSWPGALLATVGVFLPSFAVVAVAGPLIPSLRRLPWTAALLDGVSVGALALMAGVAWQLGRAAIVDVPTAVLAVVGAILLLRLRVNPTWLVLLGAASGFLIRVVA
jgi:chromate transporter